MTEQERHEAVIRRLHASMKRAEEDYIQELEEYERRYGLSNREWLEEELVSS